MAASASAMPRAGFTGAWVSSVHSSYFQDSGIKSLYSGRSMGIEIKQEVYQVEIRDGGRAGNNGVHMCPSTPLLALGVLSSS